jgi:hypothetical protein
MVGRTANVLHFLSSSRPVGSLAIVDTPLLSVASTIEGVLVKFIHHDVTSIWEFVSDRNLPAIKVKSCGPISDKASSPSDLVEMLEKQNRIRVGAMPHGKCVTRRDHSRPKRKPRPSRP